jgi:hypothetical protein
MLWQTGKHADDFRSKTVKNLCCIGNTYLQNQASVLAPSARNIAKLMHILPHYTTSVPKMNTSDCKGSQNFEDWHPFWVSGRLDMFSDEAWFYLSGTWKYYFTEGQCMALRILCDLQSLELHIRTPIYFSEITDAHRYVTRSDVTLWKTLKLGQNIRSSRQGSVIPHVYTTFFVTELSVRYCDHLVRWTKTELLRFYSLVMLKNKLHSNYHLSSDDLKENVHHAVSILIYTSETAMCLWASRRGPHLLPYGCLIETSLIPGRQAWNLKIYFIVMLGPLYCN